MREKRQLERKHLLFFLRVFDTAKNELAGYLTDLNTGGFLLICEKHLEIGSVYSMKMTSPEAMEEKWQMNFSAECLWYKPDVNPDYHRYGFRFASIDPVSLEIINYLIKHFGFSRQEH